jgi:hypothetical protein
MNNEEYIGTHVGWSLGCGRKWGLRQTKVSPYVSTKSKRKNQPMVQNLKDFFGK